VIVFVREAVFQRVVVERGHLVGTDLHAVAHAAFVAKFGHARAVRVPGANDVGVPIVKSMRLADTVRRVPR
jgi:hypothetical protein